MDNVHYLFRITRMTDELINALSPTLQTSYRHEQSYHLITSDEERKELLNHNDNLIDATRCLEIGDTELRKIYILFLHHLHRINHDIDNVRDGIYRIHPGLDAFTVNECSIPHLDIIAISKIDAAAKALKFIPDLEGEHSFNTIGSIDYMYKH